MTTPARFDELSRGLADAARAHDDLVGIVLLGSASAAGAPRRDAWSDHDFFAITADGRGRALRPELGWLPDPERIVLTAREGELGFVALYDDGHVLEFAVGDAAELGDALIGDATVLVDSANGEVAALVAAGQARVGAADRFDPAMDARLVLVKLLIGVGRARRGEVLIAGEFVRVWAVRHLVRAIRGRFPDASSPIRDAIDPVRRFETDHPRLGARIATAIAAPVEPAAEALLRIACEALEPGWADFPSAAADAVRRRLGWTAGP